MARRKISYNFLFLKNGEIEEAIQQPLEKLLTFIMSKEKKDRKQDITSEKFAFLDIVLYETSESDSIIKLMFKNAKHSYRAPLLDKNTVESRENPKTLDEGEQMKTHLLIKFKNGDAVLFLETGNNMLSCGNIVDYLNKALIPYNSQFDENSIERINGRFSFDMIARDDFDEVLQEMQRVVCAEIFVDRAILGSDVLNFSNPTDQIKQEVVVTIKADRKKDIKSHIYDIVNKFNGAHPEIKRIRVSGKNNNGIESVIDTSFIIKKEFIEVDQDSETGEYNSNHVFSQLKELSNSY